MIKTKFVFLFLVFSILKGMAGDHEEMPPAYSHPLYLPKHTDIIKALRQGKICSYPHNNLVTTSIQAKGLSDTICWTAGCAQYDLKFLQDLSIVSPGAVCVSIIRESGIQSDNKLHIQVHLEVFVPNTGRFFWEKDFKPVIVYLHTMLSSPHTFQTLNLFDGSSQISPYPQHLRHDRLPQYFSTSSGIVRSPISSYPKIAGQYLMEKGKITGRLPTNGILVLQ